MMNSKLIPSDFYTVTSRKMTILYMSRTKLKNLTDLCTKLCTKPFEAMKALYFTVF